MPFLKPATTGKADPSLRWFAGLAGVFVALVLLKFGNPVILDHLLEPPRGTDELIFMSWPVAWGYWLLAIVAVVALRVTRWETSATRWAVWVPLAWLAWQLVSATRTVDGALTREAVKHFVACVVCFHVGMFALGNGGRSTPFWIGLLAGFVVLLAVGFNQHYGGLEETRKFIYEQIKQGQINPHPHLVAKLSSERIFSTLVYPNALAGLILLLLPVSLAVTWQLCDQRSNVLRGVLTGVLAYMGLACLYWSGSKAGWLIALGQGLILLLRVPFHRGVKAAVVIALLAGGLTAFFVRFDTYFQKGAKSVVARFDYWQAAARTAKENPILGTGPGTFYRAYAKIKRPESEMARLAHNDYLQQASDSGVPGFGVYVWLILGSIWFLYRKRALGSDGTSLFVWLGLVGWAVQGMTEFALYIPASAWTAFLLLGWLWTAAPLKKDVAPVTLTG